jgi:hypothetical protein
MILGVRFGTIPHMILHVSPQNAQGAKFTCDYKSQPTSSIEPELFSQLQSWVEELRSPTQILLSRGVEPSLENLDGCVDL